MIWLALVVGFVGSARAWRRREANGAIFGTGVLWMFAALAACWVVVNLAQLAQPPADDPTEIRAR